MPVVEPCARLEASLASRPTRRTSSGDLPSGEGEELRREHRLDLGFQRLRVERLDDVIVDAGALGRDHVVGLGLGRDHDERRAGEIGIAADLLEQVVARDLK